MSYRLQRSKLWQRLVAILGIRTYSLVNSRQLVVIVAIQFIQNEPLMLMESGGFSISTPVDGDLPIRVLRQ